MSPWTKIIAIVLFLGINTIALTSCTHENFSEENGKKNTKEKAGKIMVITSYPSGEAVGSQAEFDELTDIYTIYLNKTATDKTGNTVSFSDEEWKVISDFRKKCIDGKIVISTRSLLDAAGTEVTVYHNGKQITYEDSYNKKTEGLSEVASIVWNKFED